MTRGNGRDAWYDRPADPALEKLHLSRLDAPGRAERTTIAEWMQLQALDQAPDLPLDQVLQTTAYRGGLAGSLPGFAKFWSVRKG